MRKPARKKIISLLLIQALFCPLIFCDEETDVQPRIMLEQVGVYQCGKQPKQVCFSPDGKLILLPLLDDTGIDVFSVEEKKITQRISPEDSEKCGFAEELFLPQLGSYFVSQMTTASVHEYTYPGFIFKRTIKTEGEWSKFISYCPQKNLLAVSNWLSNNISLIDYDTGKVLRKIKTGRAPRGMVFVEEGEKLLSLSFESGKIEKFEVDTGKRISEIKIDKAAMRHIVLSEDEKTAYVSDMYHRAVYEINLKDFKINRTVKVFNNPNTIALLKNRWLFVSCRGPNNKTDYTKRSPENGKIYVIDTNTMKTETTITGGNQPTGLSISPDGYLLCFSNFQDATLELWKITCD